MKSEKIKILYDCFGHKVRLTNERLTHILDHPEMHGMEIEIERVVSRPRFVRRSRGDAEASLFMNFIHRH